MQSTKAAMSASALAIDPAGPPPPPGRCWLRGQRHMLRQAILACPVGGSFSYERDNKHPYEAARQVGASITVRKSPKGGWIIWRTA